MQDIKDHLRGIAVGAVVGDALGMPLEFQPPRPSHAMVSEMLGGPLPAGTFTDDTEMALALVESLQFTNPLDGQDLAGRFLGWYHSSPSDIGVHTSHVLKMISNGMSWHEASEAKYKSNPESAGNGAVMRCWPLAIARWENPSLLVAETKLQSEVTHMHPDSVNGAILVNLIIQKIVNSPQNQHRGGVLREAIAASVKQVDLSEDFRLAIDLAPVRTRSDLKNTGWVRHTLESALWAVLTTQSFEEALVQAVNLGWDADTTGCVAGSIAGALYGFEAIPTRWKSIIHGEYPLRSGKIWTLDDFVKLADELSAAQ